MKGLAFLLFMLTCTVASACPPPPPSPAKETGEAEEAYQTRMQKLADEGRIRFEQEAARRQALLWDFNPRVFVARIERVKPLRLSFGGVGQSARLKPIRWLKGEEKNISFWLTYKGDTDCGPYGGGDAVDGKIGETFVIFAQPGRLSSSFVEDSVGVANAIDPRIVDALSMH